MNEKTIRRQLRAISAALRLVEASRRRLHRRFEHLERELQQLQPLGGVEPLAVSRRSHGAAPKRPAFFSSGDPTYALLLEKYSELNPGRLTAALAALPPSLASQVHEDLEKLRLVRPIPGRL